MNNDKPLDLTKPVQTKNGRPVRIICTDRRVGKSSTNPTTVVGLVTSSDGSYEYPVVFTPDGRTPSLEKKYSLVNVPERKSEFRRMWLSTRVPVLGGPDTTKEKALSTAYTNGTLNYTGILEIVYEDGVPVDSIIHPWPEDSS